MYRVSQLLRKEPGMSKRNDKEVLKRRDARQTLLQIAFQMEAQQDTSDDPLFMQLREKQLRDDLEAYVVSTYHKLVLHIDEIDDVIRQYAKGWTLQRLPKAELAILRIAVTEILYVDDMPDAIACNEAVELAKLYGEEKAPSYINGILGNLIRSRETAATGEADHGND